MVEFGWRMMDFPIKEQNIKEFFSDYVSYVEELKDSFNSLWVSDHFIPWAVKGPETPTLECWTSFEETRRLVF